MSPYLKLLFFSCLVAACHAADRSTPPTPPVAVDSTLPDNAVKVVVPTKVDTPVVVNTRNRVMGKRLSETGDFNGDGVVDTVFESYISRHTGKETFKVMDSADWASNQGQVIDNKPVARLYTHIPGIKTFLLTDNPQQSGLWFIENLGDINQQPGDELGYVIEWEDMSNINTYEIITLTPDKGWQKLFSFQVNEMLTFEPDNLFNGKEVIRTIGPGKIRYKYYSRSANNEEGVKTFPLQP